MCTGREWVGKGGEGEGGGRGRAASGRASTKYEISVLSILRVMAKIPEDELLTSAN